MSYRLRRLLNHLPIPVGVRSDRRLKATRLRHAQFASYMESDGFRSQHTDHHDRSLRRRRAFKTVTAVVTAFFAAWVALESVKAFTLF